MGDNSLAGICQRLGATTGSMRRWAREVFGSIRRQIARLKTQLKEAKERATHSGYRQEIKEIEEQLREIYEREEVFYRQRSRVDWLQAGDQNTKILPTHSTIINYYNQES